MHVEGWLFKSDSSYKGRLFLEEQEVVQQLFFKLGLFEMFSSIIFALSVANRLRLNPLLLNVSHLNCVHEL